MKVVMIHIMDERQLAFGGPTVDHYKIDGLPVEHRLFRYAEMILQDIGAWITGSCDVAEDGMVYYTNVYDVHDVANYLMLYKLCL